MLIVESDRAAILVCWRLRNWGEYKIPVGRGGGHPHAFNRISPTHGDFVLSPVSLASRDEDGGLADSMIHIYDLTGK